jgi:hypothetical protein
MFQTYSYTIFIVFALLQIIYILLFYRLENKQKEAVETRLLHSTKGIYFTLFTLILGVPVISIIASAMTGSLFFRGIGIGLYIYGFLAGFTVFFLFNRSVIKDYNGLYFYNDYFINVEYNVFLGIRCKEQIVIKDINSVRILYCARGRLLHLKFDNGNEDYFNIQYVNSHNFEGYFLYRSLKSEVLKIKISEFKKLKKKM